MTDCPHLLDTEAWLDGEAGERADSFAQHIALCSDCKAHVETVRRFDFAAREAALTVKAPESLLESLSDLDAASPAARPVTRRWMFGGVAAAASIAAIGAVAWRGTNRNDLPMAIFGDFAAYLDADKHLDRTESNPQALMDWFSPKVPFSLPHLASLSELNLIGGRLCWLLDRRIAAVNFERKGERLGLYLTDATGLTCRNAALPTAGEPPISVSEDGLNGAFWRSGSLAHALVGQSGPETINRLAGLLHSYAPPTERNSA